MSHLIFQVVVILMLISRGWIITNAETIVAFCFVMFILVTMPHIFSALAFTVGEKCDKIKKNFWSSFFCLNASYALYSGFCKQSRTLNADMILLSRTFAESMALLNSSKDLTIDRYKSVMKLSHLEAQTISSQLEQPLSHVSEDLKGISTKKLKV